jgi:hypothetical protein
VSDPKTLYEHVANLLALRPGVSKSQMFGMPCIKVNGKAFASLNGETMVFKLSGEERSLALGLVGSHLFEPMAGREMKEWVQVPLEQGEAWQKLAENALAYVASLAKK